MKAAQRARAGVETITAPWEPGKYGMSGGKQRGRRAVKCDVSWEFVNFEWALLCRGVGSGVVTGSARGGIGRSNLPPAQGTRRIGEVRPC